MGWLKRELWIFCKAQLSAQWCTIVDFMLSLLLAEVFGWWYVPAVLAGAIAGGIVNCCLNYRWVFHAEQLNKRDVAVKYLMVWAGSILLNTGGTYLITELSGTHFMLGKAIVAIVVAILWNYQLQRFFVYRETHIAERMRSHYIKHVVHNEL